MSSRPSRSAAWAASPLDRLVPDDRPICYGVLKPGAYVADGVPLVRILDLEDGQVKLESLHRVSAALDKQFARSRLVGGEILISIQGTVGRVAIAPGELGGANISRTVARVALTDEVNNSYLRQWLLSDGGQKVLADAVLGTTRDSLNISALRRIEVPRPPLPEQRRIAEVLDTADAAIRHTEALIAKLKQMKQGLLHDLLTRGIDENGELRDPVAHPEHFKDSPLGRIPRGWEAASVGELAAHVGSGVTPRGGSEVYQNSGIIFIRSQNVTFDGLLLDDVAYISERVHESMSRSQIFPHDVLLNITGASIGRCSPVPPDFPTANVNQHVCAIRIPQAKGTDAVFLSSVLTSSIGQSQIDRLNAGGNREGLNYAQIKSFVVPWPEADERTRIASALNADDARVQAEEAYRDKLQLVKKGLMHDLLTGRVRVPVPAGEPELIEASA